MFDRLSFFSLFATLVLLPVFFLPFAKISIETSKGLILVLGLVFSIIFWAMARFSDGKIVFPRSWLLGSGFMVVVAFLLSSIFSSAPKVSLFGTMFDISSFYFILVVFLLMFMFSVYFNNSKKTETALWGFILSSVVVVVFQFLYLFQPGISFGGVLTNRTDNILGSWNALGIFLGVLSMLSVFVVEFFTISRLKKALLCALVVLSIVLLAAVNASFSWILVGVFSLFIFIYKISLSFNKIEEGENNARFPFVSFGVVLVSLLFFISGPLIGNYVPDYFKLPNVVEVSPSFVSTFSVAKQAFVNNDPILGVGPNRFGDIWSMYKPLATNTGDFWDTHFDFGSGLLPTFFATTGIVGILSLLSFFFLYLLIGTTSLFLAFKNKDHQTMVAFFLVSLYLFIASFFYSSGVAIFSLAFICTGIFIGLFNSSISEGEVAFLFSNNSKKSFFSLLFLVLIMIFTFIFGFKYIQRLVSVSYYAKAFSADSVESAENYIVKANNLYQSDLYLRGFSQIYLLKLNSLISKKSLNEEEKASLQAILERAVVSAEAAINYNKDNYQNYAMLGDVYNLAGSLGVDGGYDKALEFYTQASLLNPLNPGLKLALARISFANKKTKEAKEYANESLSLKTNYIDALLVLSQISRNEGSTSKAIEYAEKALAISPSNENLIEYVNTLKKGGTPSIDEAPSTIIDKKPKQ